MDTLLYSKMRIMKMKSVYVASVVALRTDPENGAIINGFRRILNDAFTTERQATQWVDSVVSANLDKDTCFRSSVTVQGVDEDDLEDFAKEYEVECEVKLTFYKTFTVTARDEYHAAEAAEEVAEEHYWSGETHDDFKCEVQTTEEV